MSSVEEAEEITSNAAFASLEVSSVPDPLIKNKLRKTFLAH